MIMNLNLLERLGVGSSLRLFITAISQLISFLLSVFTSAEKSSDQLLECVFFLICKFKKNVCCEKNWEGAGLSNPQPPHPPMLHGCNFYSCIIIWPIRGPKGHNNNTIYTPLFHQPPDHIPCYT